MQQSSSTTSRKIKKKNSRSMGSLLSPCVYDADHDYLDNDLDLEASPSYVKVNQDILSPVKFQQIDSKVYPLTAENKSELTLSKGTNQIIRPWAVIVVPQKMTDGLSGTMGMIS